MPCMCLTCFEYFDKELIRFHDHFDANNICPKTKCDGDIIEVDELFLPIIKILNQKGYITTYCCSGHITENYSSYIAFDEDIELPNLPPLYQYDKDKYPHVDWSNKSGSHCIRRDINRTNESAIFNELLKNAKNVLKWAKKLPDSNY